MKTKSYYKQLILYYAERLNDIRFVGQILFVVVVLLISWSGIKAIETNYGLQKQITSIKQQNELQQLQDENLNLENQYYNSNQYLELSARQNFGLAAPGEKEVLVPSAVALAHTIDLPSPDQAAIAKTKQPTYQQNIQSWVNFFLHRPTSSN